MNHKRYKQVMTPLKNTANASERTALVGSTEKPAPQICRCPTKVKESNEDSQQLKEPNETRGQARISFDSSTSQQTTKESNDNNSQPREAPSSGNIIKVGKLQDSHPRFGPLYSVDQPSVKAIKEKAWEHILKHSSEEDPSVVKEIYLTAIREVAAEAKEIYAEEMSALESDFRWMVIEDGCFFLQLALSILGSHKQLGYPSNDPTFGKKHNKKDAKKWIEAMFFVGNQIPLVVLNELMQQNFFQQVIAKGEWDLPRSGFCKKVIYEVLVLPALNQRLSLKEKIMRRNNYFVDQQPSDLLHGLQNLVIGPGPPGQLSSEYEADVEVDLEANEEDFSDDEGTVPSAIDDRKRIFPCATELKRAGIRIKKLKSGGARSIHFKSYHPWAYLYLPALLVDDHTELIFQSLKTYEISQQVGKNRREVSSYLRVMSDIIQTSADVKLLKTIGIIQGDSDNIVEKMPVILNRLSSENIRLTQQFRSLRRQISDYSSPWVHYQGLLNVVVILTLVQTVFALLAYFRPPTTK